MNAPAEVGLGLAQVAEGFGQRGEELAELVRATVGQGVVRLAPDPFIRVEFWGIRRETLQMKARVLATEVSDRFTFVRFAVVPDDEDMTAQVAKQIAQELAHLHLPDVLAMQLEVQADPSAMGAHCQRRDSGNLVVFVGVPGERRLTIWPPGPTDGRDQEEAGFVDEGDMGAQPRGVFFTRGESRRFHSSMAASFRCVARRSGFWQLQPSECRSRPTWSRW